MLTEAELQEIQAVVAHYPQKRAAAPDALKIVQQHRRWVSDESLRDIAAVLDMTPDELDSLATFYSLIYRRPVGRHVILLCDSVTCWIMGYQNVRDYLGGKLGIDFGQTTADERFTLLPAACLGACNHAPAMMIDEDLHGDLTPETIDRVLDGYT